MADPSERVIGLVCNRSKKGDSLREISALLKVPEDKVTELLGLATQLTPYELEIVLRMKERGLSIDEISQDFSVDIEVLRLFLPESSGEDVKAKVRLMGQRGFRNDEISQVLGVSEGVVVRCLLSGPESMLSGSQSLEDARVEAASMRRVRPVSFMTTETDAEEFRLPKQIPPRSASPYVEEFKQASAALSSNSTGRSIEEHGKPANSPIQTNPFAFILRLLLS
jgi:hypothetical protein